MSHFGRSSGYLNPTEYSQLLLAYVIRNLQDDFDLPRPTQTRIAEELGVSQALVNSVIHGRKSFGATTLSRYASKLGVTRTELVQHLLISDDTQEVRSEGQDVFAEFRDFGTLALANFDKTSSAIEFDRTRSLRSFESTFDVERAFYEVLSFLEILIRHQGSHLIGATILHDSREATHAISLVYHADSARFKPMRDRVAVPSWLRKAIDGVFTSDQRTRLLFTEDCTKSQRHELSRLTWLVGDDADTDEINLVGIRRVFQEIPGFQQTSAGMHTLLLAVRSGNIEDLVDNALDQALFLAAKLGERVALYALEDRLRLAEIMLDEGILDVGSGVLESDACDEQDQLMTESFIKTLSRGLSKLGSVAALDIWRLSVSGREFYCPSPRFTYVTEEFRGLERRGPDGVAMKLVELYSKYFDELQPRCYGRTSYMVANKKAIVIQPFADENVNSYWNSAPFLGFSTLIGVPFLFRSNSWPGRLHVSVIYIRCTGDVRSDDVKAVVLDTCKLMQSDSYWRNFVPLVTPEAAIQRRIQCEPIELLEEGMQLRVVEPRNKVEWGKWTELWFERIEKDERFSVNSEPCMMK